MSTRSWSLSARWTMYQSLLNPKVLESNNHCLLVEKEVEMVIDLLTAFVKGLADMVTGCKGGPKMLGRKDKYKDLVDAKAKELVDAKDNFLGLQK